MVFLRSFTALLFSSPAPHDGIPQGADLVCLSTGSVMVSAPSQRTEEMKPYRGARIFTNRQSWEAEKKSQKGTGH